jgi:hypothetical protein
MKNFKNFTLKNNLKMNIFYLCRDVKKCAMYHCDRHVVKMILETCQLLCTAIWLAGGQAHCKPTHKNHPSAIWARTNKENWIWLRSLGLALCEEYTFRYGKTHKLQSVIEDLKVPDIPDGDFIEPFLAMPEEYKTEDALESYRKYYFYGKAHLHSWKKREVPEFIQEYKKQKPDTISQEDINEFVRRELGSIPSQTIEEILSEQ